MLLAKFRFNLKRCFSISNLEKITTQDDYSPNLTILFQRLDLNPLQSIECESRSCKIIFIDCTSSSISLPSVNRV